MAGRSYYDTEGDVALIKFEHCFEFKMGMPGEDQFCHMIASTKTVI
ncbi:hypothetical protein [Spartinivicinus ruber]|nr:hypothetical protein [Spartinivicinus ruber]